MSVAPSSPAQLGKGGKRAQLSVEYLFLFLVALFIFSISLSAMLALQDLSMAYSERVSFLKSANRLFLRMEEVCILGRGNSREVLLLTPIEVEAKPSRSGEVVLRAGNFTVSREILCPVEGASLEGKVVVANDDGLITFSQR